MILLLFISSFSFNVSLFVEKIADNSIVSGVVTERVCHMVFVKDKQNQYEPYIWF